MTYNASFYWNTHMGAEHITDADFEKKVLSSKSLVLVDFWAEWCGPCRQVGPILDELADELSGRVAVTKINIDESPNTPTKYGVRGIPTLMLFKDGQLVSTKVGALPKLQLREWIEANAA